MDDALNAALAAYIKTVPNAKHLEEFLATHDLTYRESEIKTRLRSIVGDTDDFLFAQQAKVEWTDGFKEVLFQHLKVKHLWLTRQGFIPLISYGGWLCWHEGL